MKKNLLIGLVILINIFIASCSKNNINTQQTGKVLVTFDSGQITISDIDDFKKYREDNLSDKQALEMLIEVEILYKEAKTQEITVTLEEAQLESERIKNELKQYGTEQDKKVIEDIIKELNISESEYWSNYYPKQVIKQMTYGKIRRPIIDKIHADIVENHSDWTKLEIKNGVNEDYSKVIDDLKVKYNIKYVG